MRLLVCTGVAVVSLTLFAWPIHRVLASDAPPATEPAMEAKVLTPVDQWSGAVADEALRERAPADGPLTTESAFTRLWQAWNISDKAPPVDFGKRFVVVATTSGSLLHVAARLTDAGDLTVLPMSTRDLVPGFRYQFLVLSREGVRTIDGKPLPAAPNE